MGTFLVNTGPSVALDEFESHKNSMIPMENTLTDVGATYIAALMFDNQEGSWYSGGWIRPGYLHVGTNNDTNAGTPGPTVDTPVAVGSGWTPGSRLDYRMSAWLASSPLTYKQVGAEIIAKAVFTDAQLFSGAETSIEIEELGLGLDDAEPTGNPLEDQTQMASAMLSRATGYSLTTISATQYYVENPIPWTKDSGTNLEVFYTFRVR